MKLPNRNLTDVRNEIIRTEGNIREVENSGLFSENDQEILLPKYKEQLEALKAEEAKLRGTTADPLQIPVIDPETVNV